MTRPLRICFVNPYGYRLFDPASAGPWTRPFAGAEVQQYYLATALAAREDFDVRMIVEERAERVAPAAEGVRMLPVPPRPPRVDRVRAFLPYPSVPYLRAMRRADADVYLQRGGAVLTGDVALFCRVTGRRFVFMVAHDWDCDRHHEQGRHLLTGRYYRAGLRAADLVYAQSGLQRGNLRRHHGVESSVFRSVHPDRAPGPEPRDHVLWVSRCVEWKRPLAFLDLAARFPRTPFVMIAPRYPGGAELRADVERRAAELGNVVVHDFVPFADTAGFFARALAFVNTSDAEGFPNTFVQAARAATPVLSLSVDPDGMLARAGMGFCAGGDPDRLAAELGRVLTDDATRERYGACGRRYFLREHDLAAGVARFVADLDRLRPPGTR